MIYNNITQVIGNTPIVKLNNIMNKLNLKANLYVKLEYLNPTGSVKDRAAKYMIEKAFEQKKIDTATTIIEPTSGNTGIGLASVCKAFGLKVIIVMPDTMSKERRSFLAAYGAQVILSDGKLGMEGAILKAKELHSEIENSYIPSQFDNEANVLAHYETTGVEILKDLENIDIFVSGIGSGGTIVGTSKYLKSKKDVEVIGVEPMSSPFLTSNKKGPHKIQGIGAGFKPSIVDMSVIDKMALISDEEAYSHVYLLIENEGIFCGISSGAALCQAIKEAQDEKNEGKNILAILPDNGDRYLSLLF